MQYLTEHIEESSYGDGFNMVVLELRRRREDPHNVRVSSAVALVRDMDSAAVAYEAAWTLVSLSKVPSAI